MAPAPYTVFLFDLDGTLLDSVELILASYRHTLRVHRGSIPPDDVWLAGLGTPLQAQFRHFSDDDAEIATMVATYREYNLSHHDAMVRPYAGVPEAVGALHERGVRIGVVTSKNRHGARRGLRHGGLHRYVEALVCADDVGTRHKPDPEPVLAALRAMDVAADDAVFVGDSPHDLVAGRGAGVATAAVSWGPFPRTTLVAERPDYWIATPSDLLPLASDGKTVAARS